MAGMCRYCKKPIRWYQKEFSNFWSLTNLVHQKCGADFIGQRLSRIWEDITLEQRRRFHDDY